MEGLWYAVCLMGLPPLKFEMAVPARAFVAEVTAENAFAFRDHRRTDRLVLLEIGVGVNDAGDITTCERIGLGDHGVLRKDRTAGAPILSPRTSLSNSEADRGNRRRLRILAAGSARAETIGIKLNPQA